MKGLKRIIIKSLSVMLAVVLTLTAAPLSGFVGLELPEWLDFSIKSSAATSGTCGDNLTWIFDDTTGTLTISGTGEMYDYYTNSSPWENYENSIKSIVIEDGVTSIGRWSFAYCENLTNATLGRNILYINEYAFTGSSNLETVTMYDNLITIGDNAFNDCENLTNLRLSNNLISIGYQAFIGCDKLTDITIPDSVDIIYDNAFYGCNSLVYVKIGSKLRICGKTAFGYCDSLSSIIVDSSNQYYSNDIYGVLYNKSKTELIQYPIGNTRNNYTIPNSVILIGDFAFSDCKHLTDITIPNSLEEIGEESFADCDSITNIKIPDSVKTIGDSAFLTCDKLVEITIGVGTSEIGISAFSKCHSLFKITVDKDNMHFSSDENGILFNKHKTILIQYPREITESHFIIPDSVMEISDCAFYNCNNLIKITMPKNVTNIGSFSFRYCYYLTDVYYAGTEEEWNNISIESYNDSLLNATIHYNSEYPGNPSEPDELQTGLYVFSNNLSMSYLVDDIIFLAVSQVENSDYSIPEKLSITFTNTSVVELVDIYDYNDIESGKYSGNVDGFTDEFKNCKFIVLRAKKEGITDFIVTNSDTKDTFRSYIMVSEDEYASIRADELETRVDRGEEYNFVVNGIVVSDFKYTKTSGGYDFEMNAYNQKYSLGVVEVYNADGKLIQVEKIDKFAPEDSVVGVFAEGWYLVEDFFEGELLTFKQASTSKHKHIRVFVPQEGYIRVTNDSAVSTSCFILNLFDVISSSGGIVSGTSSLSESQIDILDKKILEKFIFNTFYMETAKKYQENLKNMVAENVTEAVLLSLISQAGDIAEGLLMDIDLSFEDICREALGTAASIGEEIFTKVTGPYGATLGALMNSRTVMNYTAQMRDWVCTTDRQGYYGIMTPYNSNYDSGTLTSGDGIKVETNGNVSDEVILQTVRILKDASVITVLDTGEILNDYVAYDISLVKSGEEIQPNGPVTVYLNVPSGFGDNITVARQNEDGSWQLIEATIKNGIVNFEVNHFCKFIIGDVIGSLNITEPSRTEIRNKDGIILHATVEGNAPEGSYIRWESSNGNFNEDADGNKLEIIAKNKGWTTFTAVLCDADGNELARDSIEMYSKSGFFDKIGGFFRSLFGSTKIYEN